MIRLNLFGLILKTSNSRFYGTGNFRPLIFAPGFYGQFVICFGKCFFLYNDRFREAHNG